MLKFDAAGLKNWLSSIPVSSVLQPKLLGKKYLRKLSDTHTGRFLEQKLLQDSFLVMLH